MIATNDNARQKQTPETFPMGIRPPGSDFGPCIKPCDHPSCQTMRDHAAETCSRCGELIGYDTPFTDCDDASGHVHDNNCTVKVTQE